MRYLVLVWLGLLTGTVCAWEHQQSVLVVGQTAQQIQLIDNRILQISQQGTDRTMPILPLTTLMLFYSSNNGLTLASMHWQMPIDAVVQGMHPIDQYRQECLVDHAAPMGQAACYEQAETLWHQETTRLYRSILAKSPSMQPVVQAEQQQWPSMLLRQQRIDAHQLQACKDQRCRARILHEGPHRRHAMVLQFVLIRMKPTRTTQPL